MVRGLMGGFLLVRRHPLLGIWIFFQHEVFTSTVADPWLPMKPLHAPDLPG